jgi:hypothetical protein
MGRVRTKTTKRTARKIIERNYQTLTLDFHTNKRVRIGDGLGVSPLLVLAPIECSWRGEMSPPL